VTKGDPALSVLALPTNLSRHKGLLGEGKFHILPYGILLHNICHGPANRGLVDSVMVP
jgi:hypothetical protein